MKPINIISTIALISLSTTVAMAQTHKKGNAGSDKKVTICHIPPGNPANAHTIVISKNAAEAHMRNHGDYYGECRRDTTPPPVDSCFCDLDGDGQNDKTNGYTAIEGGISAHFSADGQEVLVQANSSITSVIMTLTDSTKVFFGKKNAGTAHTYIVPKKYGALKIASVHVMTRLNPVCVHLENLPVTDPELVCDCGGEGPPPFPVKMTSFNAEKIDEHTVKLMWSTASEENNDYFSIEKTYGFDNWEEVCRVPGHGTTQIPQSYSCVDNRANDGGNNVAYYRPKQVDYNGAYEYFNVIKIRLQDVASTYKVESVYPNPATDRLSIKYNASENNSIDISILTLDGKVLMQNQYIAKAGDQVVDVNLEENRLRPGFYILQVKSGEETYRQKVYKQ